MKHLQITDEIYQYLTQHSIREHAVLRQIREENAEDELSRIMQIAPEQGQFMAFLVKLLKVNKILEIGTSTGYSSLVMALALPEEGHLITCDINEQAATKAQAYWQAAGVVSKVSMKLAPALKTLEQLIQEGQCNSFDLAFIDADKPRYDAYYEACLELLKPDGVILIDNVLWGGSVVDKHNQQADTQAIRALNEKLYNDDRVEICMLPLSDGLTLVRKLVLNRAVT